MVKVRFIVFPDSEEEATRGQTQGSRQDEQGSSHTESQMINVEEHSYAHTPSRGTIIFSLYSNVGGRVKKYGLSVKIRTTGENKNAIL